jgi:flagellar assembly protein FliH
MSTSFEPLKMIIPSNEFSSWDIQSLNNDKPIKVSAEELFAQECEQLKKEATDQGYAEGLLLAKEAMDLKSEELSRWINLLLNPVKLMDTQLTQELIQTVMSLCEHAIGVTLSLSPEQLQGILNEIKTELPSIKGKKSVIMNPQDIQWIKTETSEDLIPGLHEALVEDPMLSRGDFYIKGENSQLDGCLQTRLTTLFGKYIDGNL